MTRQENKGNHWNNSISINTITYDKQQNDDQDLYKHKNLQTNINLSLYNMCLWNNLHRLRNIYNNGYLELIGYISLSLTHIYNLLSFVIEYKHAYTDLCLTFPDEMMFPYIHFFVY